MAGIKKLKIQVGLALLVCTLLLAGCNRFSLSGKAKGPKELSKTLVEKKQARLLKQLHRRFENPDAHYELGRLYHAERRWVQAEYEYNTALRFDPANRGAKAAMVKVLLDNGNTAKAELLADIYMNQAFSSAQWSLELALAFQGQELDEYAFACYRQALNLAPSSAKVNRQIGYYYLSKANKEQAKDYLTRSFQLDRNQPDVAGELGRLGVAITIPRRTEKDTKKLDKIVEQSDKKLQN